MYQSVPLGPHSSSFSPESDLRQEIDKVRRKLTSSMAESMKKSRKKKESGREDDAEETSVSLLAAQACSSARLVPVQGTLRVPALQVKGKQGWDSFLTQLQMLNSLLLRLSQLLRVRWPFSPCALGTLGNGWLGSNHTSSRYLRKKMTEACCCLPCWDLADVHCPGRGRLRKSEKMSAAVGCCQLLAASSHVVSLSVSLFH